MRAYLDLIAGLGEESRDARAESMLTLSALVGTILMSRAVVDPGLSDELLTKVADQLKHHRSQGTSAGA